MKTVKFVLFALCCCASLLSASFANAQDAPDAPVAKPAAAKPAPKPKTSISATAYSRIEQFVNHETFLVVRCDLDSFDQEAMLNSIDGIFTGFLKERGFDSKRSLDTNREFRRGLDSLNERIDPIVAIWKNLNIREVFLIMQSQSDESVRFFIPLAESRKEIVTAAVASAMPGLKPVDLAGGLAFVTNLEADKKIYAEFEARNNSRLKTLFENSAGTTFQVFCTRLNLIDLLSKNGKLLEGSDDLEKLPKETREAFESFGAGFQELTITLNVNTFEARGQMLFTSAQRADDFRTGLVKYADFLVDEYYKANPDGGSKLAGLDNEKAKRYNVGGLSRELTRASAQRLIPRRAGSSLVFEMTPSSADLLHNTSSLQFLFPIIESAVDSL